MTELFFKCSLQYTKNFGDVEVEVNMNSSTIPALSQKRTLE